MWGKNVLRFARKNYRLALMSVSSAPSQTKIALGSHRLCQRTSAKAETLERSIRQVSLSSSASGESRAMDGAGDCNDLTTDYEELLKAQEKGVLIIDVREQSEVNETGKLPGSIHIPMGDVSNVLGSLSDETFERKFEKPKPTKNTEIILSCRSGRRSGMVQEEMRKLGYESVYNYRGGWLDWESKQKV